LDVPATHYNDAKAILLPCWLHKYGRIAARGGGLYSCRTAVYRQKSAPTRAGAVKSHLHKDHIANSIAESEVYPRLRKSLNRHSRWSA